MSRKHCELYFRGDTLMLHDFSANGTLVNGKLCSHGEQILRIGDVLTVGMHKITVSF